MPQKSGFFDTTADDPRSYPAREFAGYFAKFIGNGIYKGGERLKVTSTGKDMNVTINLGDAWINGYVYDVYDEPLTFTIEQATTLDRIDRIALRLDTSTRIRSIRAVVLQGNPSATPKAPTIVRSGDIYDLSLAQVLIKANTTIILPEQITDERLNNQVCGIVTGVVEQADTTAIFNQFQAWLNTKTAEYSGKWSEYEQWLDNKKIEFQAEWEEFLKSVQDEGFATTQYVDGKASDAQAAAEQHADTVAGQAQQNAIDASYPRTGGDLNGDMTLPQGKKIKVKAPNGSSIDAIYHQGGDQNGTALGIGAGGLTVVGAGESAKTILSNIPSLPQTEGTEELILSADTHVRLWSGLQNGVASRKEMTFDNAGRLVVDGFNGITEKHVRISGGKLQYSPNADGTGWKDVGGGSTMMIGASDNTKKTFNFNFTPAKYDAGREELKSTSHKLFSYKFPGIGSFRIKITGEAKNAGTGVNTSSILIMMPTPNQISNTTRSNTTLFDSLNNTQRYFASALDPTVPAGALVKVGTERTTDVYSGTMAISQYNEMKWGNKFGISAEGGTGRKVSTYDIVITNSDPYHFFVTPNESSSTVEYIIRKVEIFYDEID